jgi:hypothetical protein
LNLLVPKFLAQFLKPVGDFVDFLHGAHAGSLIQQ